MECFTYRILNVCDLKEDSSPNKETDIKIEESGTYLPNNKARLMKCLISSCDKNETNVIIVTSDIDSTVMFDVTKKIIDKNVFTNIAIFLSKLEQKLKHTFFRAACGIRNNTLILNIYGSFQAAFICLERYEKVILQIINLITQNKITYNKSAIQITDAQNILRDTIIRSNEMEFEYISIHDAYNKILLKNIYSKCNIPSFRTSTKHGFAIINNGNNRKKIVNKNESTLEPSTCVYVKTGAPIPNGATAVVKVKDTKIIITEKCGVNKNNQISELYFDDIEKIEVNEEEIEIIIQPKEGENIKPIGCEIKIGEKILNKYTRIGLTEIRLLASCGVNEVEVIKHQSIGIISIGDNLEEPGNILRPKHNYDGNRLALITLLKQEGFDALDFGIVDDLSTLNLTSKIQKALEKVNILVTVGHANGRDQLKLILQKYFKATIHFDYVNVKPGKSTTYATCMYEKKKHFLCLPGNPATVLITAHLFLLPLLNQTCYNDLEAPIIRASILNKHDKHSRPSYIWTQLQWDKQELDLFPKVYTVEKKTSNLLKAHNANALLMLPASSSDSTSLSPNTIVSTLFLESK